MHKVRKEVLVMLLQGDLIGLVSAIRKESGIAEAHAAEDLPNRYS